MNKRMNKRASSTSLLVVSICRCRTDLRAIPATHGGSVFKREIAPLSLEVLMRTRARKTFQYLASFAPDFVDTFAAPCIAATRHAENRSAQENVGGSMGGREKGRWNRKVALTIVSNHDNVRISILVINVGTTRQTDRMNSIRYYNDS